MTAGVSKDWIKQVIEDKEGSVEVLLEQLEPEYNQLRQEGRTIEAGDLLVPIDRNRLSDLFEDGMIITAPCEPGYIRDPNFPTCSKKESVCRDHPELSECGGGVININIIIKIIHRHASSGSASSSMSKDCFDAIKVAWSGKIQRGQNNEVDRFIDKCLVIT